MKTDFKVENPNDIIMTMTITMKLSEWKELSEAVLDKWPGSVFKDKIWIMMKEAIKHFTAEKGDA